MLRITAVVASSLVASRADSASPLPAAELLDQFRSLSQIGEGEPANATTTTIAPTSTVFLSESASVTPARTTSTTTTTTTTSPGCTFKVLPKTPFMWDISCDDSPGGDALGCKADGIHLMCRFCGEDPFYPCPETSTTTMVSMTVAETRESTKATAISTTMQADSAARTTTTAFLDFLAPTSTQVHTRLESLAGSRPIWLQVCMVIAAVLAKQQ